MMMVELNASHKIFSDKCWVLIVSNNLTRMRAPCNPFLLMTHDSLIIY